MFVISSNLFRRHLSDYKKIELALPLERLIAKQAEQNQKAGTSLPNGGRVNTSALVSKMIGVKQRTYERGKRIRDSHASKLKGRVRRGELSISAANNQLIETTPKDPLGIGKANTNRARKILSNIPKICKTITHIPSEMLPVVLADLIQAVDALNYTMSFPHFDEYREQAIRIVKTRPSTEWERHREREKKRDELPDET